jgi:hypothetical protein
VVHSKQDAPQPKLAVKPGKINLTALTPVRSLAHSAMDFEESNTATLFVCIGSAWLV